MENQMKPTDEKNMLMNMDTAELSYSSFSPKTREEKAQFFNAVNSPQKRLKEVVNMELSIKHVYAETVEFVDQQTGVASPGTRIVLIDENGVSYQAASKGIFTSLKKLFQVFGTPDTWEEPVTIRVKEVSKGANRNVLIFEVV